MPLPGCVWWDWGPELLVLSRWAWVGGRLALHRLLGPCREAVGDAGLPDRALGEPRSPPSGPVGEAQLLPVAPGSGFRTTPTGCCGDGRAFLPPPPRAAGAAGQESQGRGGLQRRPHPGLSTRPGDPSHLEGGLGGGVGPGSAPPALCVHAASQLPLGSLGSLSCSAGVPSGCCGVGSSPGRAVPFPFYKNKSM